jgi:hypothetical protein
LLCRYQRFDCPHEVATPVVAVSQVLGSAAQDSQPTEVPQSSRLFLLAIEAWKKDLVSEGQISEMLKLDREKVREPACHNR